MITIKALFLRVLFLLMAALVLFMSCVSKEVPVTETYYETEYKTEYKTETYTETEDVVVRTTEGQMYLPPIIESDASIYFEDEGSGTDMTGFFGYEIDTSKHTRSQVKINVCYVTEGTIGVYNLSKLNGEGTVWQRLYTGRLNDIVTNPELTLIFRSINTDLCEEFIFDAKGVKEFAILVRTFRTSAPFFMYSVYLMWFDDIIEKRTVTKERQIPYQVPVQVEKQRTVTEIKKVPFWEAMLTEETPSTTPATSPASQESPASPAEAPEAEPAVPLPKLLYEDDFSNRASGLFEQSTPQGESYYKDGEFHGVVKMWDWSSWQYRRNAGRFKDFIIEEDVRLVSGPKDSNYGLIFRCQDDDNFYRFQVSANGSYVIGARRDGKWTDFQRWKMSEYVEKGYSLNHLKVVCKGSQIEVYVNGHHLTTVVDDSFADGYVGGIIYTPEPSAHVAFDNLKVYSPD